MTFSEIKQVRDLVGDEWRDVVEAMQSKSDVGAGNYRFIDAASIDEIQREELESDPYILGCFNAWFLADILSVDTETVEAMQKAEAFEGIGKLIIGQGLVADLQQAYCAADGYGHHFAHYDHNEHEIGGWYAFRVN